MQYLIRLSLDNTPLWRLIALEGKADLSHSAKLMALSFNYPKATFRLQNKDTKIVLGEEGALCPQGSLSLESLNLQAQDSFIFKVTLKTQEGEEIELSHTCQVLKAEERLYCLIPSTLVGAHKLADDGRELTIPNINAYLDESETLDTLNLKECTDRMRAFGSVRAKLQGADLKVAPFKVE